MWNVLAIAIVSPCFSLSQEDAPSFVHSIQWESNKQGHLVAVRDPHSGTQYPAQALGSNLGVFLCPAAPTAESNFIPLFGDLQPQPPGDGDQPLPRVHVTLQEDRVSVKLDGKLFTEFQYRDGNRPYFYPLIGPYGEKMTRGWPMDPSMEESTDHPHHRSLWFTHGDVNGLDFWHGREGAPRIVCTEIKDVYSGPMAGSFTARHEWQAADGRVVLTDERVFRTYALDSLHFLLEYEIRLVASHGPVTFGDTKEGSMGVRMHPALRLEGKIANGKVRNSSGETGKEIWGKRAKWVNYWGRIGDFTVGITMFDHPKNLRHPTWWHARAYGLCAANPFGIHDFEKKPAGTGDFVLQEDEELTLRYAVYLHPHVDDPQLLEQRYSAWALRFP